MNILDDTALILQFIQREGTFAANQSLRIEPAFDSIQLLARRGGLVATVKMTRGVPTVLLRRGSEYWSLVHRILVENNYIPINLSEKSQITLYEQRPIPEGYKLNCAEARFLWKEWWTGARQGNHNAIQTDLVIFCRDTWYPVREIVSSHGTLFVTTLVSEFVYQGSELIVWLSKAPTGISEKQPEPAASGASANKGSVPQKPVFRQSPGRTAFVGRDVPQSMVPSVLPNSVNSASQTRSGNIPMRPDLREVLKLRQGKLYILTSIGEVVVEGNNLKFWLNEEETAIAPKTIDISDYREREAHAVNS
ncbi:hypothetical protein J5X98_03365 [Leptothermofonsia sichuanensis E412]|uniref:hypothetical protein n=1 Tax=Leptothermofonsia sichuanensis TaxID=2917832 RepID=UPI001CA795BB|nr:hypothetical protein [Leptothermofonsia sichuanensis]QZZ21519.1 hypothetical protein J5X98_03365 [Leptothermofonsia sichuanensis E412]